MKKDMYILGIETSCDETAISVLKNGKEILSNIISTQIDIHKEFGGVVPEIASRHHIENISYVFEEAIKKANIKMEDIDYIAVTKNPGLIGSLLVGIMFAKGLSLRYNKPLIEVNHIEGHIFSNFIDNDIKLPSIHLIVSGGHTSMFYMNENMEIELIGETQDDAIGEAFDKIARVLNLPYPGGPKIDKIANMYENIEEKKELNIKIPKIDNFDFSFSGIKTLVINYINSKKMKNEEINIEKICYEVQNGLIKILDDKLNLAVSKYGVDNIYIAGGVSANKGLRNYLMNDSKYINKNIYFPKLEYCTDNAAMIAKRAYYIIKEKEYEV